MASPPVPPPGSLQFKLVKTFVDLNVHVYRLTGGRLGGKMKGAPVLLLDHLGRKTGRARTTPVLYLSDGADLVIVGSRGGSDAMPAWFLNLMSSPSTTVRSSPARPRLRRSSGFGHGWSRCTTNTRSTSSAPSARSRS
jgi:deazaflavin-dependent oxidoreductase (nitroreductase family)